jgi:Carboxypeptidase regulatory-like domain
MIQMAFAQRFTAALLIGFAPILMAQTISPEAVRADTWLRAQVLPNGSLVGEASAIASAPQVRGEVARALSLSGTIPPALLTQLATTVDQNSEFLARRSIALARSGAPTTALISELKARQNADGGFAAAGGYASNALDTSFVLMAMKAANEAPGTLSAAACTYLALAQNVDGSYGAATDARKPVLTGIAIEALQSYAGIHAQTTAISKALQWLSTHPNLQDSLANAHAVMALRLASPDPTTASAALAALKSAQSADGSFNADPYITAVALRALLASSNVPQPPTSGVLRLRAVLRGSSTPIAGVSVTLSGAATATLLTDQVGVVSFTGLVPGAYAAALSKAGYLNVQLSAITVVAGQTNDLADIGLTIAPTGASLLGLVKDAATTNALAGVSVQIAGAVTASTTTAADGRYELLGLATGVVTVSLSKTGYQTISQQITLLQNTIVQFSPSLYPNAVTPADTATIIGKLVDQTTTAPIAGGTLQIGTSSAISAGDGRFNLATLQPGNVSGTFTAAGYQTVSFNALLSAGINDVGNVALQPSLLPTTLTIRGRISSAQGGAVIAGASVRVRGTAVQTTSAPDGRFELSGITQLSNTLEFTAAGYLSQATAVTVGAFGVTEVSAVLTPITTSGLSFEAVVTNLPSLYRSASRQRNSQRNQRAQRCGVCPDRA